MEKSKWYSHIIAVSSLKISLYLQMFLWEYLHDYAFSTGYCKLFAESNARNQRFLYYR